MVKAVCVIAGDVKGNIYFEQVDEIGKHIFSYSVRFFHRKTTITAAPSDFTFLFSWNSLEHI